MDRLDMGLFKRSHSPYSIAMVGLVTVVCAASLTACSPARWHEVNPPHTGDPLSEQRQAPSPQEHQRGEKRYVTTDRLFGRTDPGQPGEDAPFLLGENDVVEVIDATPRGPHRLIKVVVIRTSHPNKPSGPIFVPPEFLSPQPVSRSPGTREYFVVENIATEKLRVYEKCGGESCAHRLILETEMLAGENTKNGRRRSMAGSYKITKWFKFYEDADHRYPSWFSPSLPPPPRPGADILEWAPRGAFGWYTAHVGPNAGLQWTHGTWGWGAEGNRFILMLRGDSGHDPDLSSHGCTRVENQAIAFMREILPVGTPLLRIYAREDYADARSEHAPARKASWDWILTTEGVDEDGPSSDQGAVLSRSVAPERILERGTYALDQTPTVASGNVYGIPENSFRGRFLVDQGRLEDYRHPSELEVGGHRGKVLPEFALRANRASRTADSTDQQTD